MYFGQALKSCVFDEVVSIKNGRKINSKVPIKLKIT